MTLRLWPILLIMAVAIVGIIVILNYYAPGYSSPY